MNWKYVILIVSTALGLEAKMRTACAQSDSHLIDSLVREGKLNEIRDLLKSEAELVDRKNESGFTPLILSAYLGHDAIVGAMAPLSQNIDYQSSYGTALMAAAVKGHRSCAAQLLDAGADPNLQDQSGNTALIYASMFEMEDLVRLLLEHKARKDLKNDKGFSAADYAKLHKNTALRILLDTSLQNQ